MKVKYKSLIYLATSPGTFNTYGLTKNGSGFNFPNFNQIHQPKPAEVLPPISSSPLPSLDLNLSHLDSVLSGHQISGSSQTINSLSSLPQQTNNSFLFNSNSPQIGQTNLSNPSQFQGGALPLPTQGSLSGGNAFSFPTQGSSQGGNAFSIPTQGSSQGGNTFSFPTQGGKSQSTFIPPSSGTGGGLGNFTKQGGRFNLNAYIEANPNLSQGEINQLIELNILNQSGFFENDLYKNQTNSLTAVKSMFDLKNEDLLIPIEQELQRAQKLQQIIEYRKQQVPNEMNNYSSQIAKKNVESNAYISQVNAALLNLQKIQNAVNVLSSKISSAQNVSQVSQLQEQMAFQIKSGNEQMNFIENSLNLATENRKFVEHRFEIIKKIAGSNQFGNNDYENGWKAAYDAALAEKRILNTLQQAKLIFQSTQTGQQNFNQGSNSLCFIKTGSKFYKTNPDNIVNNLVNFTSKTGKIKKKLIKSQYCKSTIYGTC